METPYLQDLAVFLWQGFLEDAQNFLALLGGGAFVWRLVDLYQDRVRLEISGVTFNDRGQAPLLSIEVDNNGRHPVLLKRDAVLHGLSMGRTKREIRERSPVRVRLRLTTVDRNLPPVQSRVLEFELYEDDLGKTGLTFARWLRARIQVSNRKTSLVLRLPRMRAGAVGPLQYWMGYAFLRYVGRLTKAARGPRSESSERR